MMSLSVAVIVPSLMMLKIWWWGFMWVNRCHWLMTCEDTSELIYQSYRLIWELVSMLSCSLSALTDSSSLSSLLLYSVITAAHCLDCLLDSWLLLTAFCLLYSLMSFSYDLLFSSLLLILQFLTKCSSLPQLWQSTSLIDLHWFHINRVVSSFWPTSRSDLMWAFSEVRICCVSFKMILL